MGEQSRLAKLRLASAGHDLGRDAGQRREQRLVAGKVSGTSAGRGSTILRPNRRATS